MTATPPLTIREHEEQLVGAYRRIFMVADHSSNVGDFVSPMDAEPGCMTAHWIGADWVWKPVGLNQRLIRPALEMPSIACVAEALLSWTRQRDMYFVEHEVRTDCFGTILVGDGRAPDIKGETLTVPGLFSGTALLFPKQEPEMMGIIDHSRGRFALTLFPTFRCCAVSVVRAATPEIGST